MGRTTFTGPVKSINGFEGELTLADPLEATEVSISTSLALGGGTAITKIIKGTVAVDPDEIDTLEVGEVTVTITGAAVGDSVIMHPPAAGLTAGLIVCDARVSDTNTVKVRIYNSTAGAVDEASANWIYTLIRS